MTKESVDWRELPNAARRLGIDPSTLPPRELFDRLPDQALLPTELEPIAPLSDGEAAVLCPAVLAHQRYQSRIAPRDYIDFVLLAARYDFAWSILPTKPWSPHAARMKFIRDCRAGTWTRVLAAAESAGFDKARLALLVKIVGQQERTLARCEDYKISRVAKFMQTEPAVRRRPDHR